MKKELFQKVEIPEGIEDGQKIRAKGKGKSYRGQTGDLILKINIARKAITAIAHRNLFFNERLPIRYVA